MNKLWVVISETYRKNVKSAGFIFMVLSPILFMGIMVAVGYFIGQSATGTDQATIGLVTQDKEVSQALVGKTDLTIELYETKETANEALESDQIAGYLSVESQSNQLAPIYYKKATSEQVNLVALTQILNQLQMNRIANQLNLSSQEIQAIQTAGIELNEEELDFDEGGQLVDSGQEGWMKQLQKGIRLGAAYVVSILIFIFIMNYSGIIAQEIAGEKGTRIMEIILSSVSASVHFFGKLIGILLALVTQLVIYFVIGTVAYHIPIVQDLKAQYIPDINLWQLLSPVIGYAIVFFVLGVIMYISIAAFCGSLVTKSEDVQKSMTPLTMLGLVGFYIAMFALNSPNHIIVKVASFIPFWTPFVMPFRMAADTLSSLEMTLGIGVLIIGTILITWLSVVFYRSNVLVYNDGNMWTSFKRSLSILRSERRKA